MLTAIRGLVGLVPSWAKLAAVGVMAVAVWGGIWWVKHRVALSYSQAAEIEAMREAVADLTNRLALEQDKLRKREAAMLAAQALQERRTNEAEELRRQLRATRGPALDRPLPDDVVRILDGLRQSVGDGD